MLQPTLGMDPCFKNASKIPSMPKRNEKILIGGGGQSYVYSGKQSDLPKKRGYMKKKVLNT